jgi:hypothetical protein
MCPPWAEGAHTGAPLQDRGFSYFYDRNLVLGGISMMPPLENIFESLAKSDQAGGTGFPACATRFLEID